MGKYGLKTYLQMSIVRLWDHSRLTEQKWEGNSHSSLGSMLQDWIEEAGRNQGPVAQRQIHELPESPCLVECIAESAVSGKSLIVTIFLETFVCEDPWIHKEPSNLMDT